jgi:type II secretory pathway component PulM
MRDTLLIVLAGVWLAGCAERLSSAEQEYQRSLNQQAAVRIQAEAAEELARLEQASSQDLGAPQPLQVVIVTTGSLSALRSPWRGTC